MACCIRVLNYESITQIHGALSHLKGSTCVQYWSQGYLVFPSPLPVGLFRQDQNYANSLLFLLMLSSEGKKSTQKVFPVFTDALFSF